MVRLEEYIVPYSVTNRTEQRGHKIWRYYQNPSTLDKYILFYTMEHFEKTMSTCEENENYRVQPFTNLQAFYKKLHQIRWTRQFRRILF